MTAGAEDVAADESEIDYLLARREPLLQATSCAASDVLVQLLRRAAAV